ncbi:hypothetical protein AVEN_249798-1 [Araneus ventricosus]|uniref:Transposase Tc1-like domain-containing protein n=1 Tax=Araneus ventricosus TaxID=182803 RepID=A0A4Y2IIT7_ARAVE|nr:hypothetical protein AVEN_249798-1 [Araneus ventricosus]
MRGASTSVSVRTVERTVINMGSQRRRPTRVPLLTARHKALLLSWARQHYHWTVDDCKHVAWSDESRFQLYRTGARVRAWTHHYTINPVCQQGTVQSGGASVMVWDVCSWRDMGPLIRLETTLTEMNIIEDIRDALLHAVKNRSPPPQNPMDLWAVLQDAWCELSPRYLQTLVESMPHRVAALLCVRGGPTRY